MLLTQCAACATELGFSSGKKCGRCSTRYCGPACQKKHWESGGHDKLCKKIKKAGGAEQYHADKKLQEAVAEAVEACAADTKGQTCYICTQALHWKTKEGLVRMCACRGTAGFAHVSCLAEQAKIWVAEAEENNLDVQPRWPRWYKCSLCEQDHDGVVRGALGWAAWKTYVSRPEADRARGAAMTQLGNGLYLADHHEAALSVREAELSVLRRLGSSQEHELLVQSNLAMSYNQLGRLEPASRLQRDVYSGTLKRYGEEHNFSFLAANNYANSLLCLKRFEEAKSLLRKTVLVARRVSGDGHDNTLRLRWNYARALYINDTATLDDIREAVTSLEDAERTARRVLGGAHSFTGGIEEELRDARAALRARSA